MKKLLYISFLLVLLVSVFGTAIPVNATPLQHWENSNTRMGTNTDAYNSESLANYGAVWISSRTKWEWTFRIDGTGAVRPHSGYDSQIDYATIDINKYNDPQNYLSIWTSASPEYIGTIPRSTGATPDYSAALDVVGYAVQALDIVLPGVGWAWTPMQIILGMKSGSDAQVNTTTEVMRQWCYPYTHDANQYFWFLCDVTPNKTVYFTHQYDINFRDVYAGVHLHLGPYYISMTAPGPGSLKAAAGWNPGMLSAAEKTLYGIEEIPIDQISIRAAKLGIPQETVSELLKSGEKVVYFAHTPPVKQVSLSEVFAAANN